MYENQIGLQTDASIGYASKGIDKCPTLAENIDQRIANYQRQIEALQRVKAQLASPTGLLDIRLDDLRNAMNY